MRFNCGPTSLERQQAQYFALSNWHAYFAWFPRRINHVCVWWEPIERKGSYHPPAYEDAAYWTWEYRFGR